MGEKHCVCQDCGISIMAGECDTDSTLFDPAQRQISTDLSVPRLSVQPPTTLRVCWASFIIHTNTPVHTHTHNTIILGCTHVHIAQKLCQLHDYHSIFNLNLVKAS